MEIVSKTKVHGFDVREKNFEWDELKDIYPVIYNRNSLPEEVESCIITIISSTYL